MASDRALARADSEQLERVPTSAATMTSSPSARGEGAVARRVTREVNLIAQNLACHGGAVAAAETAEHIRRFWAPQLRATLLEQARTHPQRFSSIARDAIAAIKSSEAPYICE